MKLRLYIGFVDITQFEDKCIAQVASEEAVEAVRRLFPKSKWWTGMADSKDFTTPYTPRKP